MYSILIHIYQACMQPCLQKFLPHPPFSFPTFPGASKKHYIKVSLILSLISVMITAAANELSDHSVITHSLRALAQHCQKVYLSWECGLRLYYRLLSPSLQCKKWVCIQMNMCFNKWVTVPDFYRLGGRWFTWSVAPLNKEQNNHQITLTLTSLQLASLTPGM